MKFIDADSAWRSKNAMFSEGKKGVIKSAERLNC